jgi:hypothetical protein
VDLLVVTAVVEDGLAEEAVWEVWVDLVAGVALASPIVPEVEVVCSVGAVRVVPALPAVVPVPALVEAGRVADVRDLMFRACLKTGR